jgi:hypothetical protein
LSDYLDGRRIGTVRSGMDQSVGLGLFSFTEKPDDIRIDERGRYLGRWRSLI